MPAISRYPAYIAGKKDFNAGKPSDAKAWESLTDKQRYWDGYMRARLSSAKPKRKKRVRIQAAPSGCGGGVAVQAYDWANDEVWHCGVCMDIGHGLTP